jgi:hypothetical protein
MTELPRWMKQKTLHGNLGKKKKNKKKEKEMKL